MKDSRNVALIPARAGSKRAPGKNVRLLNGKPLIAYSILAAQESLIFDEIIVSTDSREYMDLAKQFGIKENRLRPASLASDSSPDIDWVNHAVSELIPHAHETDRLCILRPTSPLRTGKTIRSAIEIFADSPWASSLRALERVTEHPGKMWRVDENNVASPYLNQEGHIIPTHSRPTQSLEPLFVQNASLEITTVSSVKATNSIAGDKVLAFTMPEFEGLDLNSEIDFNFLEFLITSGKVRLSG
jgi:CMP-N,N'-diacetyllegionaminic acid synthase